MIQSLFQIVSNECIARNTYKMVLSGDVSSINRPGQFVNIKLKGFFLRRPISVCDIDRNENTLTIVYKVVGKGTKSELFASQVHCVCAEVNCRF